MVVKNLFQVIRLMKYLHTHFWSGFFFHMMQRTCCCTSLYVVITVPFFFLPLPSDYTFWVRVIMLTLSVPEKLHSPGTMAATEVLWVPSVPEETRTIMFSEPSLNCYQSIGFRTVPSWDIVLFIPPFKDFEPVMNWVLKLICL